MHGFTLKLQGLWAAQGAAVKSLSQTRFLPKSYSVMATQTVLFESKKLKIEMAAHPDHLEIRPIGTIDEEAKLDSVLDAVQASGPAIRYAAFDMGQVNRINSCGVREWILLIQRLEPVKPIQFFNLSEVLVELANVIPNMFGSKLVPIISFQAPYRCNFCHQEMRILLKSQKIKFENGHAIPPSFKCKKCSKPLEFDWIEDEYFGFLKRA